jgi:hypothetical protein
MHILGGSAGLIRSRGQGGKKKKGRKGKDAPRGKSERDKGSSVDSRDYEREMNGSPNLGPFLSN